MVLPAAGWGWGILTNRGAASHKHTPHIAWEGETKAIGNRQQDLRLILRRGDGGPFYTNLGLCHVRPGHRSHG